MKLGHSLTMLSVPFMLSAVVASGQTFYGDPPDETHPWAIHDANRPQPKLVTPGTFSSPEQAGRPPSDAVVLFDGTSLAKWRSTKQGGGPAKWAVRNGYMEVAPGEGDILTTEEFGDCQLHIEWAAPTEIKGSSQGRGNSGVFFMGNCEVQILDNYDNPSYADGMAGSVYGVNPPMVNALRAPGQFQVYDIVFRRPIYKDGKAVDPGYLTVFVNGVLVQDHTPLEGATGHMGRTVPGPFPAKGPLKLQDHGNPMRFRNIWYRPLPIRSIEGGTDGRLTPEATKVKREEIATAVREKAGKIDATTQPVERMYRLFESLVYAEEAQTRQEAEKLAADYVQGIQSLPADKLQARKDEVRRLQHMFNYLARFKYVPADYAPRQYLNGLVKAQKWDK